MVLYYLILVDSMRNKTKEIWIVTIYSTQIQNIGIVFELSIMKWFPFVKPHSTDEKDLLFDGDHGGLLPLDCSNMQILVSSRPFSRHAMFTFFCFLPFWLHLARRISLIELLIWWSYSATSVDLSTIMFAALTVKLA